MAKSLKKVDENKEVQSNNVETLEVVETVSKEEKAVVSLSPREQVDAIRAKLNNRNS